MEQARESSDEWSRDQPPVGGHRGDGQVLSDGLDPVKGKGSLAGPGSAAAVLN